MGSLCFSLSCVRRTMAIRMKLFQSLSVRCCFLQDGDTMGNSQTLLQSYTRMTLQGTFLASDKARMFPPWVPKSQSEFILLKLILCIERI